MLKPLKPLRRERERFRRLLGSLNPDARRTWRRGKRLKVKQSLLKVCHLQNSYLWSIYGNGNTVMSITLYPLATPTVLYQKTKSEQS